MLGQSWSRRLRTHVFVSARAPGSEVRGTQSQEARLILIHEEDVPDDAFVEDGRTALATLKSRLSLFTNMDASFVLEITVLEQLQGEAGVSLLEKKLMEVLPRAGAGSKDIVSVELALERLIALRESEAYQYVGEQARSSCDILQETLGGMQQGIAPNIEKLKVSPFFRKVIDLLPLLSQCPGTKNSSGFSKTCVPQTGAT